MKHVSASTKQSTAPLKHVTALVRRWYGEGPLHLLLLLASFALALYAGVRLLADDWVMVAVWFVGAALLHDLVLVPVYAAADRVVTALVGGRAGGDDGGRGGGRRARTMYVRVPAALSLLLLLVWYPLITRQVPRYERSTTLPADVFLTRWLLVTAALFAGSALWCALRAWSTSKSASRSGREAGTGRR
ncbi:hypothetical protein ACFWZT_34615 [Streptomyces alboflavus]|uniref:hypothetical protein n=1 Tax=Streptomyces alboflavus TaxID=67267 RepID=UPI00367B3272